MKNKRREDQREPQPKPLEELLRASEADIYGQVCWSIANRGTERPRVGEVITLNGDDENRGNISETYRLTHKSIENIERCLGMKTCGEAVDLFAEERGPVPSGEPSGECPHGHQEAALAYMMYGVEPTAMLRVRRDTNVLRSSEEPQFQRGWACQGRGRARI